MARRATAGHQMLRATEHPTDTPEPTHDVHAVDESGESLFTAAGSWSLTEAQDDLERIVRDPEDWPEGVADYEIRER